MTPSLNRRDFLKVSALASSALILPRHVVAGSGEAPPSEKLNIAGIGIGGMGANNWPIWNRRTSSRFAMWTSITPPKPSPNTRRESMDRLPGNAGETKGH